MHFFREVSNFVSPDFNQLQNSLYKRLHKSQHKPYDQSHCMHVFSVHLLYSAILTILWLYKIIHCWLQQTDPAEEFTA